MPASVPDAVDPAPIPTLSPARPPEPHEAILGTPDLDRDADALGGNANLPNPEHDPSTDAPPESPLPAGD